MTPAELRAGWEAAYRRTEYRVELPDGELMLRAGQADALADTRLRQESRHTRALGHRHRLQPGFEPSSLPSTGVTWTNCARPWMPPQSLTWIR